jgi:hypothetical protein
MTSKKRRRRPTSTPTTTPGVLQLDRQENKDRFAKREPLFSVDGVEYTIPTVVPVSWTIRATNLAMNQGEAVALMYAMLKMLGEDGLEALQNCETLSNADLEQVTRIIADKVLPTKGDAFPKDSSTTTSGDSEA